MFESNKDIDHNILRLNIHNTKSKNLIEISDYASLDRLKKQILKIYKLSHCNPKSLKVIYNLNVLNENKTLREYGIKTDDTIIVMVTNNKGSSSNPFLNMDTYFLRSSNNDNTENNDIYVDNISGNSISSNGGGSIFRILPLNLLSNILSPITQLPNTNMNVDFQAIGSINDPPENNDNYNTYTSRHNEEDKDYDEDDENMYEDYKDMYEEDEDMYEEDEDNGDDEYMDRVD